MLVPDDLGPYEEFVHSKLAAGVAEDLSDFDIIELRNIGDYVKYRDEFIRAVEFCEQGFGINVSARFLILSSLYTIAELAGESYRKNFNIAWRRLIESLDGHGFRSSSSIDLDSLFNSARLGLEAKLDISEILAKVAVYLDQVVSSSSAPSERERAWSIVVNHFDVLTSIYETDRYEEEAIRIDRSVEALRVLRGG